MKNYYSDVCRHWFNFYFKTKKQKLLTKKKPKIIGKLAIFYYMYMMTTKDNL